jgi:hypothetical protein
VRLFQGPEYTVNGRIDLGDDADNIRVDQGAKRVIVGYGSGALAVIEAGKRTADIRLSAHPESFQLDPGSKRIYVNVPNRRAIGVVDLEAGKQVDNLPMTVAWLTIAITRRSGCGTPWRGTRARRQRRRSTLIETRSRGAPWLGSARATKGAQMTRYGQPSPPARGRPPP